jgi:hypothetical protein
MASQWPSHWSCQIIYYNYNRWLDNLLHSFQYPGFLLTNCMELCPSQQSVSCPATQEPPKMLWKPKVPYSVYKCPPLVPILNQISPVHTTPSYLSRIHFNIIYTLTNVLSFLVVSFLLAFPLTYYMHSSSPLSCYVPAHIIFLDLISLIMLGEEL